MIKPSSLQPRRLSLSLGPTLGRALALALMITALAACSGDDGASAPVNNDPATTDQNSGAPSPDINPGGGSGEVPVSALPPAEILWDTYGVPHIYAQQEDSALYALGWSQMQAHGDLLLQLMARSRGRAAEYFGQSGLQSDGLVRRFGIAGRAQTWLDSLDDSERGKLNAFVAGLNDFANQNPSRLSPAFRQVLPVAPMDILAHTYQAIHMTFISLRELSRIAASLASQSGATAIAPPASNSYAIAPSRSASGNSMLVINPHLEWGDLFTWFEAQINLPESSAYGVALVGAPFLGIAFSEYGGWTHTVNQYDGADFYALERKDGGYVLDGDVKSFETRVESLKIRQPDGTVATVPLEIKATVHGPVVFENDAVALAVRVAAWDSFGMFSQYRDMAQARNLAEFSAALARQQLPFFNTVYSSRDGDIAYSYGGRQPKREIGDWAFWQQALPGNRSDLIWQGTRPYAANPQFANPASGFIHNANDAPWTSTFPYALNAQDYSPRIAPPTFMDLRAQRSLRSILEDDSITYEELVAIKQSNGMELADRILTQLCAAAETSEDPLIQEALAVLLAWDRQANADSRGTRLFQAWADRMFALEQQGQAFFRTPWSPDHPTTTPEGLADPRAAVVALNEAAQELKQLFGRLDVAHGDVLRLRRAGLDLPASGCSGKYGCYRVSNEQAASDGLRVVPSGDTFVAVVEFGDQPKARGILSYGNSSQPGSIHQTDQLPLYSRGELRDLWLTRASVEANLLRQETVGSTTRQP